MKGTHVLGLLVAIALVVFGIYYPVPEKRVSVSSSYKAYDYTWNDNEGAQYLGGDAYNYEVEASLKAGYMSGVLAMKSITFVSGIMLFFITLYSHNKIECLERFVGVSEENKRMIGIIRDIINE